MGRMATRLRLADLLAGLSTVADMGYGLPQGHALRSCLIGVGLARRLGLPEPEVADTFYASMLVHVGCVGFSHEMYAAFGDEMAANRAGAKTNFADPKDIFATLIPETMRGLPPSARVGAAAFILTHGRALGRRYDTTVCEVGRETARRLGLSEGVQRALYEVKEHWKGGGAPRGLKAEQILLPARIARVAAEAALFDYVGGSEMVVPALRRRAGGLLDPAVVAELLAQVPEMLDEVRTGDPRELVLAAEPDPVVEKELSELPNVAAAFGDLADLKSTFTHGHSRNVARLAKTGPRGSAWKRGWSRGWRWRLSCKISDVWGFPTLSGKNRALSTQSSGSRSVCTPTTRSGSSRNRRPWAWWPRLPGCIMSAWIAPDTTGVAEQDKLRSAPESLPPPMPFRR